MFIPVVSRTGMRRYWVVQILRGKRLAGHATAIPYPFILRVGEVCSMVEARKIIEKFRLKGFRVFYLSQAENLKESNSKSLWVHSKSRIMPFG